MTTNSKPLRSSRRESVYRYALAGLIFSGALALRFLFDETLPPGFPFLTFFPAIIITAFICGTGPGAMIAIGGFFAAWYFFIPPVNSFKLDFQTGVALSFYVFIASVDIVIIDRLTIALRRLATERARAERFAEDRRTMLIETHHRIGNNLQTVSSLLLLQARVTRDETAKQALMDSVSRISVIASVQRHFLTADGEFAQLDQPFLQSIVESCVSAAGMESEFEVSVDSDELHLPAETFIPVGLILTECINNAIEHARPEKGRVTRLRVESRHDKQNGMLQARIIDDGPGLKPDFDWRTSRSIGMKVIASFVRQLSAAFDVRPLEGRGTEAVLTVPLPEKF